MTAFRKELLWLELDQLLRDEDDAHLPITLLPYLNTGLCSLTAHQIWRGTGLLPMVMLIMTFNILAGIREMSIFMPIFSIMLDLLHV